MKDFDFEEELKKLPHSPGVYIMHSASEEILYVGKAVDLHNRVRQYFRKGHGHNGSPKIASMVSRVAYFEYIITSSEMEALVLECNLKATLISKSQLTRSILAFYSATEWLEINPSTSAHLQTEAPFMIQSHLPRSFSR